MTVKDVLIAARAKIEKPENWTRGMSARDADGQYISPRDPKAVCWCSAGAVYASVPLVGVMPSSRVLRALDDVSGNSIETFNDNMPHSEVLAVFDQAIAAQPN